MTFFLRAAFVQGLFVIGVDFPFTREFDGRQHLIKEIYMVLHEKNYWDGGKDEVIHHIQKIIFLKNKLLRNMFDANLHIRN